MQNLKQKVAKGAMWTLAEKLSCQIVRFVVGMILARLLTPSEYGTVALLSIFFVVAGSLTDCGFGNALIQKKDSDELDFNSVFYLHVVLCILSYVGLFFSAPLIAKFYKEPILVEIVRVSGISLLFNAINAIQCAELTKKMLFHLSFRVSLITTLTSAVVGVVLACLGWGVWALVWTGVISGFVGMVARWWIISWRPRWMFSVARLKPLFLYGWKMAVSNLVDVSFSQINGLLIGRWYSKDDLAYVNRGNGLPQLVMSEVDGTLGQVTFPALVQLQDNIDRLRNAMRHMMQCSTFLMFPLMAGMAICASDFVFLVYGRQWEPAVPYMRLACFSMAIWPFHTINLRGIMALGRSDLFLKLELIKKGLKLLIIVTAIGFGVFPFMCACAFALGPLSVLVNAWPNRKLLGYTLCMQLVDVFPAFLGCILEGAAILAADFLFSFFVSTSENSCGVWIVSARLLFKTSVGILAYFCFGYVMRIKAMGELLAFAESVLPKSATSIFCSFKLRFCKD